MLEIVAELFLLSWYCSFDVATGLPSDFAVVNIHTKPGYKVTRYEVDALVDVYDYIVNAWGLQVRISLF